MDLFGYHSDGRKNTSDSGFVPTSSGYNAFEQNLKSVRANGKRVDPNDPDIKRLAMQKGKTVEDYLKYDLGQW